MGESFCGRSCGLRPRHSRGMARPRNDDRAARDDRVSAALSSVRFEHDLDAVVLFVQEHVIPFGRLTEPQAVRDDETGIDLPVLNPFEQRAEVALYMRLPGLDRERLVHDRAY